MVSIFQYDSTYGKFQRNSQAESRKLFINGESISIFQEWDPPNIEGGDAGAEYTVESTGVFPIVGKAGA